MIKPQLNGAVSSPPEAAGYSSGLSIASASDAGSGRPHERRPRACRPGGPGLAQFRTDVMARLDRLSEDIGVNMSATASAGDRDQRAWEDMRLLEQEHYDLAKQVWLIHRRLIALEERLSREQRP